MVRHRPQSGPEEKREGREARASQSMLVFRTGSVLLGIPARYVDALHAPPQITPVPLAPSYVAGVAILRGEVVPLLDIEKFLELEQRSEASSASPLRQRGTSFERVAVVEAAGMHVGVLCNEVRGIIPVSATPSAEGRVTKGRMLGKVVAEEVNTEDGVLVVLDLPKLLEEARVKL